MAVFVLTDADIWLDEYHIQSESNQVSVEIGVETPDVTVFGNSTRTMVGGLFTVSGSIGGMVDYSADDAGVWGEVGAGDLLMVSPTGTDGDTGYLLRRVVQSYNTGGAVGDVMPFTIDLAGRNGTPPVQGTILHDMSAETSTSTGTGRQLGAIAAGESMYAGLFVSAVSGTTPTLDVVIESDDNAGFTSATSRITFTQATAVTSEFKTLAGAVTDDYWRISFTIGGSSPSFTFGVVAGIR